MRKLGYVLKEEQKVFVRDNDMFAVLPMGYEKVCFGHLLFFLMNFRVNFNIMKDQVLRYTLCFIRLFYHCLAALLIISGTSPTQAAPPGCQHKNCYRTGPDPPHFAGVRPCLTKHLCCDICFSDSNLIIEKALVDSC